VIGQDKPIGSIYESTTYSATLAGWEYPDKLL